MGKFTISAFKHETIEKEIEAKTVKEAVDKFKKSYNKHKINMIYNHQTNKRITY